MEQHDYIYIYPRYINAKAKQKQGRRIAQSFCPENPTCQQILNSIKQVYPQIKAEIQADKQYSRSCIYDYDMGRIKMQKIGEKERKLEILKSIAQNIKKQQSQANQKSQQNKNNNKKKNKRH